MTEQTTPSASPSPRPTRRGRGGRRAGDSGTRTAIATAARRQFADQGFDRTSVRSVAQEAGVDPALVHHFHGSKQQLFLDVTSLPFDPAEVIPRLVAGPAHELGLRLATFVMATLEQPVGRERILGLVRAACAEPEAARLVRELLTRELLLPIAQAAGGDDPAYRAGLAMSQVVGVVMARYIVAIDPLAQARPEELVASLAPTLQRYLIGDT